jgi:hypothetical protein
LLATLQQQRRSLQSQAIRLDKQGLRQQQQQAVGQHWRQQQAMCLQRKLQSQSVKLQPSQRLQLQQVQQQLLPQCKCAYSKRKMRLTS